MTLISARGSSSTPLQLSPPQLNICPSILPEHGNILPFGSAGAALCVLPPGVSSCRPSLSPWGPEGGRFRCGPPWRSRPCVTGSPVSAPAVTAVFGECGMGLLGDANAAVGSPPLRTPRTSRRPSPVEMLPASPSSPAALCLASTSSSRYRRRRRDAPALRKRAQTV